MHVGHLKPGRALGRYELLMPVAQGGMAQVWAARLRGSRGFQKLVAIKTMLPHLSDDARFEQMFLDEARLASRVRHPHVVEIHDLGEQDDVLYLVMEWIDGETLASVLRRANGPVPPAIASRLVQQACAGLHAAHELCDDDGEPLGLVHRDVSPQNVLVTRQGAVKIVDFGIAKALRRIAGETAVGSVKGKVPYMAPEQALAQPMDRRVDVFALGIVFYFLLTGVHPFRGDDESSTMLNVIAALPRAPREVHAAVPEELERVVLRALARDPEARFATMTAFETAIAQAMTSLGVTSNDQDIKDYVVATVGDTANARRAALVEAMRDVDLLDGARRAAATKAEVSARAPAAASDDGTSVTAVTKDEASARDDGANLQGATPARRDRSRVAWLLAASLLGGGTLAGVWLYPRAAPHQAAGRPGAGVTPVSAASVEDRAPADAHLAVGDEADAGAAAPIAAPTGEVEVATPAPTASAKAAPLPVIRRSRARSTAPSAAPAAAPPPSSVPRAGPPPQTLPFD
ncbi:MAG TPA: serine/threonine-protein kinase [Byssovorax sp.]|jgi:serine/threonine-protein kinase